MRPTPVSTYRVQLHAGFPLRALLRLVPYLDGLGISHVYLSPCLAARPGSAHGYDQIDFGRLNPEIGAERDLARLAAALHGRGMGLILDFVPNHMCIAHPGNRWWWDVLESGRASRYAGHFDIAWEEGGGRVLLPVLGVPPGEAARRGEIRLVLEEGAFRLAYYDRRFPLEPGAWARVLEAAGAAPRDLLDGLAALPGWRLQEAAGARRGGLVRLRRLLAALLGGRGVRPRVERALARLSGDPRVLGAILDDQPYRLAFWREGRRRINYRRFFEIDELAGVRVEDHGVFRDVHRYLFELIRRGWVDGVRIDHIDGLYDPARYLRELQRGCREAAGEKRPFYVLVEKILARGEALRRGWPVAGTTGYEYLNLLGGLFVDGRAQEALCALYREFGGGADFGAAVYRAKGQVLREAFLAELRRLARMSAALLGGRESAWEGPLAALVAAFPVYRTYLTGARAAGEDRARIEAAFAEAARRAPRLDAGRMGRLRGALLGTEAFPAARERALRRGLVMRLQQLTGPAMAKGFEDTALYRHFPLASLNDVGGEPDRFGCPPAEFHREGRRLARWPGGLLATSTHDTKRSEDVRARLSVLSEIPGEWARAARRWRHLNRRHKRRSAPDGNDEYLLYQTLVGAWPPSEPRAFPDEAFAGRIRAYMLKAVREAKRRTSWTVQDAAYEEALLSFVDRVLGDGAFLGELRALLARVVRPGAFGAVSQALLKIASPGVPDFFQGCETHQFTLVDPDNRRPVDHAGLRRALGGMKRRSPAALARALAASPEDGRLKLFVTACALRLRRERAALFAAGRYAPLRASGPLREHVVAFARGGEVAAAGGRFFARLGAAGRAPAGEGVWGGNALGLPPGRWRDALTGREVAAGRSGAPLAEVFAALPAALLERVG